MEKSDAGFSRSIVSREESDLPEGELLIEVKFSSLNLRTACRPQATPVSRNFPHTPGIDAAGVVLESSHDDFVVGDDIIAIGFDLAWEPRRLCRTIRIPAGWAVKCPSGLTLHSSMIIGTAGFTAANAFKSLSNRA